MNLKINIGNQPKRAYTLGLSVFDARYDVLPASYNKKQASLVGAALTFNHLIWKNNEG
jgi:hypothetical protein